MKTLKGWNKIENHVKMHLPQSQRKCDEWTERAAFMFHCHGHDKEVHVACICVDIAMRTHTVLGSVNRVTGSKHCVAQQVVCTNSRVAFGSVTRTTKNNIKSHRLSLHEDLVFGAWAIDPGRAR